MMDPQEQPKHTQEKTTTMECILCCPHFEDKVLITPKDLNNTPVKSKYNNITVKKIQKRYFEAV